MKHDSDAIADLPILNALLNTASGALWVSVHHGGGVGISYSIHAGQVIVADGTLEAAERLSRVVINDSDTSVMCHANRLGRLVHSRGVFLWSTSGPLDVLSSMISQVVNQGIIFRADYPIIWQHLTCWQASDQEQCCITLMLISPRCHGIVYPLNNLLHSRSEWLQVQLLHSHID